MALLTPPLLAGQAAAQQAPTGFDSAAVDSLVAAYLDRHGLPGAAVAVVKDGRPVHQAGYGHDSDGEPQSPDTRLRVASVSKPITAFAVLQLVDDGAVALDRPVRSYLPELEMGDPRIGEVTVRQPLSHTSGIETPTVIPPASTLREAVAMTHDWALASKPGTRYAYSNANYWIAARLVEVSSGQSFASYLRDHVFEPLGMSDSLNTPTTREPVPGLARGHVTAYGLALPAPEPEKMVGGAGGLVTAAHDMAAWMAMQQRAGVAPTGKRLLSAALIEECHQPQPGAPRNGLGWHLGAPGIAPARVGHSGVGQTFQPSWT